MNFYDGVRLLYCDVCGRSQIALILEGGAELLKIVFSEEDKIYICADCAQEEAAV